MTDLNDDFTLARRYAESKSEDAFAALVARHVNLVYSVALRAVRDQHLAEEITQTVFVIFASKIATFDSGTIFSAWLCRTARFVASRAILMHRRRQEREHQAFMDFETPGADASQTEAWTQIAPHLDAAMSQLQAQEQSAVTLRFFENRPFKEIGFALNTTEAAAKMRVNRALEKMRKYFLIRGVTLSTALIASAMTAHSVQAAPAGLAAAATLAGLKGATASASSLTLLKTSLKIMAWTKMKTAAAIAIAALLSAGIATVVIHQRNAGTPMIPAMEGYATPEGAIRSSLWLGSKGDFEGILRGCTPEQVERFRTKMAGKSAEQIRQETIAWAKAVEDLRLREKEVISDHEVLLHLAAPPSPDGLRRGQVTVIMHKIDDEWKQAGDR